MTIETTYLVGDAEPFDETLRYYFSSNWVPSETNDITPVFLSPHGKDSQAADLENGISQADINSKKASALIVFQSTEHIPIPSNNNLSKTIETPIGITIYGRSKYEIFLLINHINDIILDNMPSGNFRIKKSDGIQDSAIAYFKQTEGVKFSQPLVQDKEGHVFISSGSLTCMSVKTKTS